MITNLYMVIYDKIYVLDQTDRPNSSSYDQNGVSSMKLINRNESPPTTSHFCPMLDR